MDFLKDFLMDFLKQILTMICFRFDHLETFWIQNLRQGCSNTSNKVVQHNALLATAALSNPYWRISANLLMPLPALQRDTPTMSTIASMTLRRCCCAILVLNVSDDAH